MALDKEFLRYKLERIKNKRIFKDQDTETKIRIRKENAKLAKEEADAIHSYLTGEDDIDKLMTSYVEVYSKQIDITELSSIDMFQTYYDIIVSKYCCLES